MSSVYMIHVCVLSFPCHVCPDLRPSPVCIWIAKLLPYHPPMCDECVLLNPECTLKFGGIVFFLLLAHG